MQQPTIWTHSGVFHADDVFAVAIMQQLYRRSGGSGMIKIIRSRTRPDDFTYAIDVGGEYDPYSNMYDHHQPTGRHRENGVKYAAVGLLWESVGHHLIDLVVGRNIHGLSAKDKGVVFNDVDSFFMTIDAYDNGQSEHNGITKAHTIFNVIKSFYPLKDDFDFWEEDAAFYEALSFADRYLETIIASSIKRVRFSKYVNDRINHTVSSASSDCRIMVLEKACPFLAAVNDKFELCEPIKVVVYPGKSDDNELWYIRTMPGSLTDCMCSKCPAPETLRGLDENALQNETGIKTIKFVHPTGFLGGCSTKEDALKLASLWVDTYDSTSKSTTDTH